ncbi:helix-turn-helix transcriptional regulator [Granulicatella sp. 19428wC4_WM01]|nr:helix-turn-helix transcriptional regulator [Granulicatella sp. 19428wC4_WM01]TFU96348.1 XRE family transcriptional regulator [Granulicatella sp. WM01]
MMLTLKAARVNCNLTILEASNILGVNKDSLSRIERNSTKISRSLSKKMSKLYQIPEEHLFFGDIKDFPLIKTVRK